MSKSRLEKFLYALYSLDSSDLPAPLSRIEELYKCLVTGEEAPTFEPLSRVEKYLMAILGGYDVDSLPNPLSRVEVLLYKLATGDDNLDDVKSFLSEHEELLAEIIRNGGVGGNIDIEYVLYTLSTEFNTLYNTAEKPVKSAILKGKTINNLWAKLSQGVIVQEKTGDTTIEPYSEQYAKVTFGETQVNASTTVGVETTQRLQANKTYYINTFIFDAFDVTDSFLIRDVSNNINLETLKIEGYPAGQILSFTTQGETNKLKFYYFAHTRKYGGVNYSKPFYMPKRFIISDKLEDVVNQEFFEGMKSVKMPVLTTTGKNIVDDTILKQTNLNINSNTRQIPIQLMAGDYFIGLTLSNNASPNSSYFAIRLWDKDFKMVRTFPPNTVRTISLGESAKIAYMDVYTNGQHDYGDVYIKNLWVAKSSSATPYEPYKTNILSTSEDVELRGIGDVKDELDCLTGEVVKRIEETVLNGSENWVLNTSKEQPNHWCFSNNQSLAGKKLLISDKFPQSDNDGDRESIRGGGDYIFVYISKEKVDRNTDSFKQWLSQNPITVQYQLTTESIKTIDISTVNQEGNNTKLSSFEDITHVTLSSEGLIPEAELEVEVAEKVTEVAASMLAISHEQEVIDTTTNEQSENVDSTMMATTEIYEGLL